MQVTPTPEKWWEVTVICPFALEDTVYWAFEQIGSRGTASQRKDDSRIVTAYFPQVQLSSSDFERFQDDLLETTDRAVRVSWRAIDNEDWAKSWKTHWQPEEVGDRLLINPAWLEPPDTTRSILTLDPGSAFGTGAHATTQLCLQALEKQDVTKATIADIGCGSGILSIVSLLYGANQIYAADVDPLAISSTRSNANLNNIPEANLQIQLGSLPEVIGMARQANALPVDGIVCNILSEIIVGLILPQLSELAGPDTWGILSGILASKAAWVEEHLTAYGWKVAGTLHQDEWCAMNICLDSTKETTHWSS